MSADKAVSLSKRRREREHEEMNARIKDIAREMFVHEGYEAVTLQKIADALEYTRPALYRYFTDKNELLAQIVLEDMEELHALLMDCATIADPLERLTAMARKNGMWAIEWMFPLKYKGYLALKPLCLLTNTPLREFFLGGYTDI